MEAGPFYVYLTLTASYGTATLFARNNPTQGVTVPAYLSVLVTAVILLVELAAVVVVARALHRGQKRRAAAVMIGSYLLAALSLGVALAGWL